MHKTHPRVAAALLSVVTLFLMGCAPPATAPPVAPTVAKQEVVLTIASVGTETRFDKPILEAPAGSRITVEMKNSTPRGERIMQNWVLVQPGQVEPVLADTANESLDTSFIKKGDPRVIAFTFSIVGSQIAAVSFDAPPPGRYPFICTTPRHETMRGELVIR